MILDLLSAESLLPNCLPVAASESWPGAAGQFWRLGGGRSSSAECGLHA